MKLFSILLVLILSATANALSRASMLFLTMPQSPEAIGRAGMYLDSEDADPLSVFTQPAQWGLLANTHRAQAASYLDDTRWLPDLFSSINIRYSARAMYYGFDQAALKKYFEWNAPLTIAVGFSEANLDLGETERRDENNHSLGIFHSYENSKGLTIAGGLHHECWQFGFGLTTKYLRSKFYPVGENGVVESIATGIAHDAGIQFHWDVAGAIRKSNRNSNSENSLNPTLNISANYSMTNIGRAVNYSDEPNGADPLPRQGILGFNIITGLQYRVDNGNDITLVSAGAGIQAMDELIGSDSGSDYHYRNPLGGIQPYNQFLGGQSNRDVALTESYELTFFETFSIRRGEHRGGDYLVSHKTEGFGVSAAGLVNLFRHSPIRHFDLQYHQSRITFTVPPGYWPGESGNNDMTYNQLTLGWKY